MTNAILAIVIPFIIFGMYQLWICAKEDEFEWEEEEIFEPEPQEERRIYFFGLPLVEFDEEEE